MTPPKPTTACSGFSYYLYFCQPYCHFVPYTGSRRAIKTDHENSFPYIHHNAQHHSAQLVPAMAMFIPSACSRKRTVSRIFSDKQRIRSVGTGQQNLFYRQRQQSNRIVYCRTTRLFAATPVFNQLMARDRLPDTIAGIAVSIPTLKHAQ